MHLSGKIKPIRYLKVNAAKLAEELKANGEAYLITQNGEAAMVIQSIQENEQTQETLTLLKILAQSQQAVAEGQTISRLDNDRQLKP